MAETRLRFPRLGVALDVTVEAGGMESRGRILDLSRDAVKVRWLAGAAQLQPGANVRLQFALRDRELPFWVTASVARTSPESAVLWFVDLEDQQFQRVRDLVDSLLQREWQQVLDELVMPAPSGGGQVKPQETSAPSPEPPRPEPVEEQASATPEEEATSSSITDPDKDKLKELLAQAGLNSLCFPSSGVLTPQWKEFLKGLGSKEEPSGAPPGKKWWRRKD